MGRIILRSAVIGLLFALPAKADTANLTAKALVEVTGCSKSQEKQIRQRIKQRDEAIKAWDQANKPKLSEIRRQIEKARKARNYDALGRAVNQQLTMETSRQKLAASLEQKVLAVLKPDQLARWIGHRVTTKTTSRLARLKLSEQQTLQIQQWAIEQAGQMLQTGKSSDETVDRLAKTADTYTRQKILTDKQRDMLKPRQRADREALRRIQEEKKKRDATSSSSRKSDGRSGASRKR